MAQSDSSVGAFARDLVRVGSTAVRVGVLPAVHAVVASLASKSAQSIANVTGFMRVGYITSAAEAVNRLNKYIADASPKHDLSTESWRAVWVGRFGWESPGVPGKANHGGISKLLDDIGACPPQGCDAGATKVINGLNQTLGLAADNGWMTLEQLLTWLSRSPVNADDPPGTAPSGGADAPPPPAPPPDPNVISQSDRNSAAISDAWIAEQCASAFWTTSLGAEGPKICRAQFETQRADARAKIAHLEAMKKAPGVDPVRPPPLAPKAPPPAPPPPPPPSGASAAEVATAVGAAPVALGALLALKFGWALIAAGGVLGAVAAAGTYAWMKVNQASETAGKVT